jgi:hypothetical protein
MFRHKLDATYLVKLDSTSDLKIMADGTLKNNTTESTFFSSSLRENETALNGSLRTVSNSGDQRLFNSSILWNKKLKKKGRTLSLSAGQRYSNDDSDGYLNSVNRFYNTAGAIDSIQNIDQYKTNLTMTSAFTSNLAYTEPLTKTFSVILNYGLNYSESNSDRKSFNRSATGKYDILDQQFSNNFDLTQTANQAGAVFSYRQKKTVITFGSRASLVDFDQTDLYTKKEYDRNFVNWIPQASYQYNFSNQKSFSIRYNGNTTQPNITQIQPIRVNTDPLNITLGNPELGPSFNNRLNMSFNSYKVISDRQIYLNLSYSFTSNAIVSNTITDAAGKSTFQSINLTGETPENIYGYVYLSRKIPGTDIRVGLNSNIGSNTYYNMINNVLNKTRSSNYNGQLSVSKYKLKKYDIYLAIGPGYSKSQSDLQKNMNNNGWTMDGYFGTNWELPGKLKIGMNGSYAYQQKTQSFNQDFDRLLLNTTLTKSFMKNENLKLQLSGNDLLNQNVGFSRRASSNIITQNSYTTIRRYALLSVIYDLSKMGGPESKK